MKNNRIVVLALSVIAMTVPRVSAQAVQVRIPVTFTLSGCTSLPAGLTVNGSGESFVVINSRVDQNGVSHIEQNTLTVGTATDSNGATYLFNYHNHVSLDVPPGGFPFQITIGTDHFNLVGDGKANQLQVHFVARATF